MNLRNKIKSIVNLIEKTLWILLIMVLLIGIFGVPYLMILDYQNINILEIFQSIGFIILFTIGFVIVGYLIKIKI